MNRSRLFVVAAVAALPAAGIFSTEAYAGGLSGSSSATILNANATLGPSGDPAGAAPLTLPNAVLATGSAPPAYNVRNKLASYTKSVTSANGITLNVSALGIGDTALSLKPPVPSLQTTAISNVDNLSATLASAVPGIGTFFTFSGTSIESKAAFRINSHGGISYTGSAAIGSITINAPYLGINNVTFSGKPTVNQILFQNAAQTLTIYLNAQTTTTASGKLASVKVDAVDVHFANFSALGATVSGDLEIGSTSAN